MRPVITVQHSSQMMETNQPELDANQPSTVDEVPGTEPDTQERSDATAALPTNLPDDDLTDPVDNINTNPALTPADAGEVSGTPGESLTPDEAGEVSSIPDEAITSDTGVSASDTDEVSASDYDSGSDDVDDAPASDEAPRSSGGRPASRFSRGQLIEGTIINTTPTTVTVDLGEGSEGVISSRELERMNRKTIEGLKAGEPITVYVVNPHDHQGNVVLSVNRAMEEVDWQEAERYRGNQEAYEGNVAGYNKGGLIVRFGRLRGFVPQSQMSDERRRILDGQTPEERYSSMVNDPVMVKVMEVDRSRNRLILSERAATREVRERRKEDLIHRLEVGQVVEGRVVSLEDFGAFVDVGGAEGLVHLTELSWKHVNHPRDLLKVGQTVRVEVISVDPDRKRIGLSMKRQEADPWDEVATAYGIGQLVQATITKLTKFGAFARLVDAPDIEGLIHISELSDQRVTHPREVVREGEKLTLRVVKVDVKNRRLGLSLKRVNSAEYLDLDMNMSFASNNGDAE